jgi:teichuronic acid biosynthesis glycosyltransferase TuaG
MTDLVSIVVPVYNAGRVIGETIDSVLKQSHTGWELILVDDGSTDESVSVIEEYRRRADAGSGLTDAANAAAGAGSGLTDTANATADVSGKAPSCRIRLIKNTGEHGACHARNKGTEQAEGRYLCFLDADDLWDREKLSKQLSFMRKTGAAFSFTGYEFADENGKGTGKIVKVPPQITYEEALKNTTIFTSTVMFDLSLLGRETVRMPAIESEDTACWWRILRGGVTAYGLNESLTLYRRSAGTLSSNKNTAIRRIWRLYREAEGLSVIKSAYCFVFWAVRAVLRRI